MKTPILLIGFNRPDLFAQVFARVRQARPPMLFVSVDGPRPERPTDTALVEATKREIRVDWDCDVHLNFTPENLGCGVHMAQAVTWAFESAERLIMLEDDTLPHPDYFPLVDELLDCYAEHKHIWCISGARASREQIQPGQASYYFSHQVWTCSLATWRDRWAYYDFHVRWWADPKYRELMRTRLEGEELALWERAMNEAFVDSWKPRYQTMDYQYQAWVKMFGYGAITSHNMITNTGFRADGTNATDVSSPVANLPAYPMPMPLVHPPMPEPLPWGLPELPEVKRVQTL